MYSQAMKMLHFWVVFLCTFLISSTSTEKCSSPVQQGSSYTTSYSGKISDIQDTGLGWYLGVSSQCKCCNTLKCDSSCDYGLQATIRSTGSGMYQSDFIVPAGLLTRNFNGFLLGWVLSASSRWSCELEIYDYRSSPSCSQSVTNTGSANNPNIRVTVDCQIDSVFPQPRCQFHQSRNGQAQESVPLNSVTEHDVTTDTTVGDVTYSRRCTMTRPVTDLAPGQYTFEVNMYPGAITDGINHGKSATASVNLSIPKPTCSPPSLTNSNTQVTVTCQVSAVYPRLTCDFYRKKDGANEVRAGDQQESGPACSTTGPPASCSHQCTLTLPVTFLGPGRHSFKVAMAAKGVGGRVDSDYTTNLALSYPASNITNCPVGQHVSQDFIKQGTAATCECGRLNPGNPPGRVQWVTSDGTEVGTSDSDSKATLTLTYNSNDRNPLYHCQGVSNLGQGNRQDYRPKFAYGPESIAAFVVTPSTYNLCPPTTDPIAMTCDVDQNTVNPKPDVAITGLDASTLQLDRSATESGKYTFRFSFRPTTGQRYTATCVASNAVFPELRQQASREITVQEPPPSAPVVSTDSQSTVTDGQSVSVTSGQPVQVQCSVQGGFPAVTKVRLTCAGGQYEADGTQLTQSLTLDKTNNGDQCSCTAVHPSGCYDKSTGFTFNVFYGPETVTATTTTPTVTLCPSNPPPTDISMHCDVPTTASNPKPTVVVRGLGSDVGPVSDSVTSNSYRFQFTITPTIGGNLTAKCVATNSRIPSVSVEDPVVVTVVEPPPSAPVVSTDSQSTVADGQSVKVISGRPVEVQCSVEGGFPAVTKVRLTCAGHQYEADGTQLTQSLTLNKTNNGDQCNCTAVHPSGCYDKSTGFTFNVQYPSTVTNYYVEDRENASLSKLEVDAGTSVTFSCQGEGNPQPDMTIKSQRLVPVSNGVTTSGAFCAKIVATKSMACADTGIYTCEASNDVDQPSNKTILILVTCTPELQDSNTGVETHNFVNGTDLVIKVKILGYPTPTDYVLTRSTPRAKRSTDGRIVDKDKYNVTYTVQDELYGTVSLEMHRLTDRDNGQYELKILNGVGDGLKYSFIVNVKKESSGDDANFAPIIGGIAAGVIVIIIIIVCCYLYRKGYFSKCCARQKTPKSPYEEAEEKEMKMKPNPVYGNRKDGQASGGWARSRSKGKPPVSNRDSDTEMITNDLYGQVSPAKYGDATRNGQSPKACAHDEEVVIQNDLYGTGPCAGSDEVMIQNDLYGTNRNRDSEEVMIQNDLYGTNPNRDSEEVMITNDLYGKAPPANDGEPAYRDYTTIEPTITTASAVPKNLNSSSNDVNRISDNPYEDLEADGNLTPIRTPFPAPAAPAPAGSRPKPKPTVPSKPRNLSTSRNETGFSSAAAGGGQTSGGHNDNVEDIYTEVIKDGKAPRPTDNPYNNTEETELFPPQSDAPIIPEKSFNTKLEKQMKKKKEKQKKGQQAQSPTPYTNNAALDISHEDDLYANVLTPTTSNLASDQDNSRTRHDKKSSLARASGRGRGRGGGGSGDRQALAYSMVVEPAAKDGDPNRANRRLSLRGERGGYANLDFLQLATRNPRGSTLSSNVEVFYI